jgi:hypothetical protein
MLYEINEKALKLESQGKKIIKLNLGDLTWQRQMRLSRLLMTL